MKILFLASAIFLIPFASFASELSVYDCGDVARVIKDVEAQSSHRVEVALDSTEIVSLRGNAELVSLDGANRIPGTLYEGSLVFVAVTPGSWRICDAAKKLSVSNIVVDDTIVQASSTGASLANVAAGTAAIGGGVVAMVFGSRSNGNGQSSESKGVLDLNLENGGSLIDSNGAATSAASFNTSAGSSSSIVSFVGHNETAISPFS